MTIMPIRVFLLAIGFIIVFLVAKMTFMCKKGDLTSTKPNSRRKFMKWFLTFFSNIGLLMFCIRSRKIVIPDNPK